MIGYRVFPGQAVGLAWRWPYRRYEDTSLPCSTAHYVHGFLRANEKKRAKKIVVSNPNVVLGCLECRCGRTLLITKKRQNGKIML